MGRLPFAISIALSSTLVTAVAHAADAAMSPALDLRPPAIQDLYTPEQIERLLSHTFFLESDVEEIEVEGSRPESVPLPNTPDIPGGATAIFWAVANPAQAWRIFAPIPDDRAVAYAQVNAGPYIAPAGRPQLDSTQLP